MSLILLIDGNGELAAPLLFLPYTIRQLRHGLCGAGEFFTFSLVLISTITIVYPAYKFIQEFLQYNRILEEA